MTTSTPQDLWQKVLLTLRGEIPDQIFELWLRHVQAVSLEGQVLHLRVPNRFFSDQIRKTLERRIGEILLQLTASEIALSYSAARDVDALLEKTGEALAAPVVPRPESAFSFSELNPRYTFENFVVGPSNRYAHATAEAIAKKPGREYNPLVIYGGVGLGKTHLMTAIGHALRREHPGRRVLYSTAEHFFNEYIEGIQRSRLDAFRSKYRSLDCLLLDDVQFFIAKGKSEEEFFHTFNTLFESRKQVVITCDRAPREMNPMEQRLISRLEWGVVTDIKPPDLETRIAILRKKAETERVPIPNDVLNYIAGAVKSNIRQLEGALTRVASCALLTGTPASVDLAKDLLKDMVSVIDASTPVSVDTIQRIVAQHYSVDVRDLKSKRRTDAIALPRQIAMYLCLDLTGKSTTEVGEIFGGRDHSTVIHSREKIKGMLNADPFFSAKVNKIIEQIRAEETANL